MRMNKIFPIDRKNQTITAEPGALLIDIMPERLALLFFLIGGADLFRKLSQERDELVRKLLRLKLPGGRKGVTEQ